MAMDKMIRAEVVWAGPSLSIIKLAIKSNNTKSNELKRKILAINGR